MIAIYVFCYFLQVIFLQAIYCIFNSFYSYPAHPFGRGRGTPSFGGGGAYRGTYFFFYPYNCLFYRGIYPFYPCYRIGGIWTYLFFCRGTFPFFCREIWTWICFFLGGIYYVFGGIWTCFFCFGRWICPLGIVVFLCWFGSLFWGILFYFYFEGI